MKVLILITVMFVASCTKEQMRAFNGPWYTKDYSTNLCFYKYSTTSGSHFTNVPCTPEVEAQIGK